MPLVRHRRPIPLAAGAFAAITLAAALPPADAAHATSDRTLPDTYEGHVQVVRGQAHDPEQLTGTVFDDRNKNSKHDDGEKGIPGVAVSNGRDVVTTDGQGRYSLPAHENMTAFVTQPAGWQVPVDEFQFAQFSYNHLPEGSPELEYGGIEPTGDLPQAVNFPMVTSQATAAATQSCPIASDTQAYDMTEMGYARDGAVADLAGRHDYGGCGILLLGDNVGDDLSLFPALKDIYRQSNGPIRAAAGNHDMDFDAPSGEHAFDTFRQHFGPTYFSYDVGSTHFVVLDSIEYPIEPGSRAYREEIDQAQLDWLKADLENVPRNAQIVIATHAPIVTYREIVVDNALELYEALEGYRNVTTVGGHTHTLENLRQGERRAEWAEAGIEELPFTQLVAGAVSGDWYSGGLNSDGLPYAFTSDGAQPGVLTLEFDGASQSERYTVRGESDDYQIALGLNTPSWRSWAQKAQEWQDAGRQGDAPELGDERVVSLDDVRSGESWLTSSFYAGSRDARVEVSIDGRRPQVAEHTQPGQGESINRGWEHTDPYSATHNLQNTGNVDRSSSHLWRAALPETLPAGTHRAEVTATDRYGREFTETIRFTVVESTETEKTDTETESSEKAEPEPAEEQENEPEETESGTAADPEAPEDDTAENGLDG